MIKVFADGAQDERGPGRKTADKILSVNRLLSISPLSKFGGAGFINQYKIQSNNMPNYNPKEVEPLVLAYWDKNKIYAKARKKNSGKKIGDLFRLYQDNGGAMVYKSFQRKIASWRAESLSQLRRRLAEKRAQPR